MSSALDELGLRQAPLVGMLVGSPCQSGFRVPVCGRVPSCVIMSVTRQADLSEAQHNPLLVRGICAERRRA